MKYVISPKTNLENACTSVSSTLSHSYSIGEDTNSCHTRRNQTPLDIPLSVDIKLRKTTETV